MRAGGFGRVPPHLRDAHYPGAKRLGHGKGYLYPHDSEVGVVAQQYLPDELRGSPLLRADRATGSERDVQARLEKIRRILAAAEPRLLDLTGSKRSFRVSPSPNTPSVRPDVRADREGQAIRP